ncbi:MAG: site-2 protease family protein [Candidatus Bathyarchaeia archaeon]
MSTPSISFSPLPNFLLDFGSIRTMLEYRFTVLDAYVDVNGLPTFVVAKEPIKEKFQELLRDLRNHALSAKIRQVSNKLVISVFPKPVLGKPRKLINVALFLATMGTVGLASYYFIFAVDSRLTAALFAKSNLWLEVILLAISILGIVGIHEMGHVMAVRHHRMDASLPYFVPAPPPFPFGTFGAVISLRGPPGNRDQLFDLGFSGPIAGFFATIAVALFAYFTSPIIPQQQADLLLKANLLSQSPWPYTPLLLDIMERLSLRTVPAGQVLVFTQIALAAEVGALITFLNILPVWQLDGGHLARAAFGVKGHKIAALAGFGILMLAGYWGFAMMLIIFMLISRRPLEGVEPLDDVSPLSNSRKLFFLFALVMFLFCFVIIQV